MLLRRRRLPSSTLSLLVPLQSKCVHLVWRFRNPLTTNQQKRQTFSIVYLSFCFRRQACVCAVRNAKSKALEVVQMFNQSLGPPILIREEHYEEFVGNSREMSLENKDMEQLTFQEKVAVATVTVTVKIFAIFEIREKMKARKQKWNIECQTEHWRMVVFIYYHDCIFSILLI